MHIFCDGSETAFGAVAYLLFIGNCSVSCSIVLSKVRLTPISRSSLKTVPRIEMSAAKLSVAVYSKLIKELEINIQSTFFWTDSLIVLNYIHSDSGRFHRFIANRVAFIRAVSKVEQWRFVPGSLNPADLLSRGTLDVEKFNENKLWIEGPEFLKDNESSWPLSPVLTPINENDCEVKSSFSVHENVSNNSVASVNRVLSSTNDWHKIVLRVACLLKFIYFLKHRIIVYRNICVADLVSAELSIFRCIQRQQFGSVFEVLNRGGQLPKSSPLAKLRPFVDAEGVLRAGGRLAHADMPFEFRYPVLLPNKCSVVRNYVEMCHRKLGHLGREAILADIRKKSFI